MDFVVAGVGIGALLVVIGFVARDVGPLLARARGSAREDSRSESRRLRWCSAIATGIAICGSVIIAATIVAVAADVSDTTGGRIVFGAAIAGLGIAVGVTVRASRSIRRTMPDASPALDLTAGRQTPRPLFSRATYPTVRRMPDVASVPAAEDPGESADASVAEADEPFDATRLLAEEFGEAFEPTITEAPKPIDVPDSVITVASAPGDDGEPEAPERDVQLESEIELADDPERDTFLPEMPAEIESLGFRSPLLAGIEVDEGVDRTDGQFSSQLLADVAPEEASLEAFLSPLLADVATPAQSGPAPAAEQNDSAVSTNGVVPAGTPTDETTEVAAEEETPVGESSADRA